MMYSVNKNPFSEQIVEMLGLSLSLSLQTLQSCVVFYEP